MTIYKSWCCVERSEVFTLHRRHFINSQLFVKLRFMPSICMYGRYVLSIGSGTLREVVSHVISKTWFRKKCKSTYCVIFPKQILNTAYFLWRPKVKSPLTRSTALCWSRDSEFVVTQILFSYIPYTSGRSYYVIMTLLNFGSTIATLLIGDYRLISQITFLRSKYHSTRDHVRHEPAFVPRRSRITRRSRGRCRPAILAAPSVIAISTHLRKTRQHQRNPCLGAPKIRAVQCDFSRPPLPLRSLRVLVCFFLARYRGRSGSKWSCGRLASITAEFSPRRKATMVVLSVITRMSRYSRSAPYRQVNEPVDQSIIRVCQIFRDNPTVTIFRNRDLTAMILLVKFSYCESIWRKKETKLIITRPARWLWEGLR